jgi:chromosome partitioning protein
VTDSDDVAERGRAIFQRLREAEPDVSVESDADEPSEAIAEAAPADDAGTPDPEVLDPPEPHADGPVAVEPSPPAADGPVAVDPAPPVTPLPAPAPVATSPAPFPRGPLPGAADLPPLDAFTAPANDDAALADTASVSMPSVDTAPQPDAPQPDSAPVDPAPVAPPEPAIVEPEAVEAPVSHFARPLPRVMAVANQKGGVGKTTTAVNLGACLADIGYRVLVVDLDPQGNASTGLGINIRDLQGSMYDVILHDLPIEDCVEATSVRNLFCAPSSLDLAGAEIELVPAFSRELRLKRALDEVRDDYDFVLIDCPPSLGLLTVNGLAAATEVVVPIQCEYYALEGLGQLLRNVNLVQRNLNPGLEVSAIILVMYDARTKLADQVVSEVREHFGTKVCRNVVPRTVRLSEAPSFGQPIIAFDSSSRGAIAYRELAKEVSGGTPQRAR